MKLGMVNENWLISSSEGKYILRRVHHNSENDLLFEIEYTKWLKSNGFHYQVPFYLHTKEGPLFVKNEGKLFLLYRNIERNVKLNLLPSEVAQVARMMALYHGLVEKSTLREQTMTQDVLNTSKVLLKLKRYRSGLSKTDGLEEYDRILAQESPRLMYILQKLESGRDIELLPRFPLHCDITPGNLVWKNGGLVGLLDFERVSQCQMPLIKDLAVFFQHSCTFRTGLQIGLITSFLREYKLSRKVSSSEICSIPIFIISGLVEGFTFRYYMMKNGFRHPDTEILMHYSRLAQWIYHNLELVQSILEQEFPDNAKW